MISPAIAAQRFGISVLLGAVLGIYYGFLRPLRPKHTALSDLLFLPAAAYTLLYMAFAVCRGDLRPEHTVGLFLGGFGWELTVGRLLRPVFSFFWRTLGQIIRLFTDPYKNILKKLKKFCIFLLCSGKKASTIKWNNRQHTRRRRGGVLIDKKKKPPQPDPAGVSTQFYPSQMCGSDSRRALHPLSDALKERNHKDQRKHRGKTSSSRRA